jgi:hypothetical protein
MLTIVIDGNKAEITTENKDGTTGATKEELLALKTVADEYCGDCNEGSS